jgi:glycosyltransferase involved in cell wall biosynthesis
MISVVIPTKNSERTLGKCLESLRDQTYQDFELIIVDGFSDDRTLEIAGMHTDRFFTEGGTIPAARNLGFSKAKGGIFVSIDSDMVLERNLLEDIAAKIESYDALIIPEVGYGSDFISRCKDLEKRCYIGDELVESARAFRREVFDAVEGYDRNLVFGEDWDLHWRIKERSGIGRTDARLMHNTENISMASHLKKAYRYGSTLPRYLRKKHLQARMWLLPQNLFYIKHFRKLMKEPMHAAGLLVIKTLEYAVGSIGFLAAKLGLSPFR